MNNVNLRKAFIVSFITIMTYSLQTFASTVVPCGQNETNCWECGNNCTARLDSSGKLSISGTGTMRGYGYQQAEDNEYGMSWKTTAPWGNFASSITSIDVQGVSNVSDSAFIGMGRVTSVNIGESVENFEIHSFSDCDALTSIVLPQNTKSVNYNFIDNSTTKKIFLPKDFTGDIYGVDKYFYEKEGDDFVVYKDGNIYGIYASYADMNSNNIVAEHYKNLGNGIIEKRDGIGTLISTYYYSPDGSLSIYDASGKLIGLQGKRILTIDEATALVSGNKNTFSIRYR